MGPQPVMDLTGSDDDAEGDSDKENVDDVVEKFLNDAIELGAGPGRMGLITVSDSDLAAIGGVDWEVFSTTD